MSTRTHTQWWLSLTVVGQHGYLGPVTNVRNESPAPYVIPLSWDGTEVLSVEPRPLSGWAAYFSDEVGKASASVFLRLGPRWSGRADAGDPDTDRVAQSTALEIREVRIILNSGAVLRSAILRSVPQDRIEAAINLPEHRPALQELVMPGNIVADDLPGKFGAWCLRPEPHPLDKPDLRVEVPEGYRKPDEFYRTVGELFQRLSAISSRAAQEIAEANDVKPTTVHRWIREAKARGLLVLPSD